MTNSLNIRHRGPAMPFSAKAVANEFLDIAQSEGQELTAMKLQKLVYFAHGWYLAWTGCPLISESVQAWQYGPVISSLYGEFKVFGNAPITTRASGRWFRGGLWRYGKARLEDENATPEEIRRARELIHKVWELYGGYSSARLSNATHAPGSPWAQVYQDGVKSIPIPNDSIKAYFEEQANAQAR